ncbi:redox-sensitive transcriptional activator SoxR [Alteromonas sp. H39]|uniref:redox-sensitive transcriptional activator SoxR n=1 Tax=Alteromonas sp. H39 TaxID=3389876 RepID=UPI0039E18310
MDELTVGEVAARCGVNVSALHFYERQGLIHSRRNTGNQRRFGRDTIRRVSIIKVAQQMGIPLKEIETVFAELPVFGAPRQAQWEAMAKRWQVPLQARITQLQKLEKSLTSCIGCGCLSMKQCPLYNQNDKLADRGPGPVLLQPDT